MNIIRRYIASLIGLIVVLVSSVCFSDDRDTQEVHRYRLNDANFAKYQQAIKNFQALPNHGLQPCEDADGDGNSEGGASIDQQVAAIDAVPGVRNAILSAGLTTREWVVFGWALFEIGLAETLSSQTGAALPPNLSQKNLKFYRRHQALIQKLSAQMEAQRNQQCNNSDDEMVEDQ